MLVVPLGVTLGGMDDNNDHEHGAIDLAEARRQREQAALAAEIEAERAEAERRRAVGEALVKWQLDAEARGELPRPRDDDPPSIRSLGATRRPARGPAPATAPETDDGDDEPVRPIAIVRSSHPHAATFFGLGLVAAVGVLTAGWLLFRRREAPDFSVPRIVPTPSAANFFGPMAEVEDAEDVQLRLDTMRIEHEARMREYEIDRRVHIERRASMMTDRFGTSGVFMLLDDGEDEDADEDPALARRREREDAAADAEANARAFRRAVRREIADAHADGRQANGRTPEEMAEMRRRKKRKPKAPKPPRPLRGPKARGPKAPRGPYRPRA